MATLGVRVCSLDVGQGMCTFVEVYETNGSIIRTLLFDLGSSKGSNEATVDFIAQQVRLRQPTPFIDGVFISHKDSDHVSMIPNLLAKLPDVGIGLVRYGGRRDWYTKSPSGKPKFNTIELLAARCTDPTNQVSGFSVGDTNNDPGLGLFDSLWDMDEVTVYLLAVNTPYGDEAVGTPESGISATPDGDQANSKSLVCYVWYNAAGFVISGDATFPTMVYMNGVFKKSKLPHTKMLLLPHHGSRKTTFGLSRTDGPISAEAGAAVSAFARKMGAKTIIASANTQHSHPSMETTALFHNYSDKGNPWWSDPDLIAGTHFVTLYQDISMGTDGPSLYQYRSFLTPMNVYSTLYMGASLVVNYVFPPLVPFTPPPPPPPVVPAGMNFFYRVLANKDVVLQGVSSGRTTTVEQVLFGEDAEPQPPPEMRPPRPAMAVIRSAARPALTDTRASAALPGAAPLGRVKTVW